MGKTYCRANNSVLGFARIVSDGVDNSGNDPNKTKNCRHFWVKETSSKQKSQEDSYTLKCVLVNSLKI